MKSHLVMQRLSLSLRRREEGLFVRAPIWLAPLCNFAQMLQAARQSRNAAIAERPLIQLNAAAISPSKPTTKLMVTAMPKLSLSAKFLTKDEPNRSSASDDVNNVSAGGGGGGGAGPLFDDEESALPSFPLPTSTPPFWQPRSNFNCSPLPLRSFAKF